jgi:hypothetical protein
VLEFASSIAFDETGYGLIAGQKMLLRKEESEIDH